MVNMKSSALATAILLVSLCSANAQNSASELKVIYPSTLQGDIVHRSALFGSANFGVHNQEIAKITPLVQGSNSTSTSPCPVELPDSDTASDEVLLLMGWSQCRFVQEAVYAQDLVGAKGLIVVENKCLKSNMVASTTTSAFVEHCKTLCNNGNCAGIDALSYMGGVNHNVHIPSMIISRWDGLRLLECLEQQKSLAPGSLTKLTTGSFITDVNCAVNSHPTDQKVLIDLKWNLPQASKVEYEIWMSSILNADIFTKQLWYENVSPLLEPKTSFTPHMFVYDGSTLGCLSSNGESHCFDACHNGGRYCHYDPDGLGIGRISGADISRENLRQLCLWKILVTDAAESSKSAGEQKWWEYISRFASNCTGEDEDQENPYKESCSKQVHQDMGLDMSKTLACITQSGGYGDNDGANSIMEAELAKRSNMEIIRLPTVIVNGKMIEFGSNPIPETATRKSRGALCSRSYVHAAGTENLARHAVPSPAPATRFARTHSLPLAHPSRVLLLLLLLLLWSSIPSRTTAPTRLRSSLACFALDILALAYWALEDTEAQRQDARKTRNRERGFVS